MSAHKKAHSLLHLCLNYYSSHSKWLFSGGEIGAFGTLPSSAIEYVLDSWIDQCQCSINALERIFRFISLFGRRLRRLQMNLKIRQFAESCARMERATAMCTNAFGQGLQVNMLQHLELYDTIDANHLNDIILNLHSLTFLKIIEDNLDDRTLQSIARNCPLLRELHLLGLNFSDAALTLLTVKGKLHKEPLECDSEMSSMTTTDNREQLHMIGCPKLRRLVFYQNSRSSCPKFSSTGVAALLLQLGELYQLQIPHHVLCETLVSLLSHNHTTRLRLTSLDVNLESPELYQCLQRNVATIKFATDGSLCVTDDDVNLRPPPLGDGNDITVAHCARALTCLLPHLCKLSVTLHHEAQFEGLRVLSECVNLAGLSLTLPIDASLSESDEAFARPRETHLNQLLRHLPQLDDLELHNLVSIDMSGLGGLCPRLERLQISNVKWMHYYYYNDPTQGAEEGKGFSRLKQLMVCGHCDCRLDERSLLELFCPCHQIEVLVVSWCAELSDQLMLDILQANPMLAIERLEFHELSDRFSIQAVRRIVFTRIRALTLNIFACSAICLADVRTLSEEIRTQNRSVYIKYYDI